MPPKVTIIGNANVSHRHDTLGHLREGVVRVDFESHGVERGHRDGLGGSCNARHWVGLIAVVAHCCQGGGDPSAPPSSPPVAAGVLSLRVHVPI